MKKSRLYSNLENNQRSFTESVDSKPFGMSLETIFFVLLWLGMMFFALRTCINFKKSDLHITRNEGEEEINEDEDVDDELSDEKQQ